MPSGISMSQFGLRWILMFDAHTCAIPAANGPIGCGQLLCLQAPLTDEQMAAVSCKSDLTLSPIGLGA